MMEWLLAGARPGEGSLIWTTDPMWIGLAAVLAVLTWCLAVFDGGTASRSSGTRVVKAILWGFALCLVVLGLAGPEQVEEDGREELGKLVVLMDGSASMGVAGDGATRGATAVEMVETLRGVHGPLEVYTFDEMLRAGISERFDGRGTDIGAALDTLADRHLGQELRGIVLMTDGLDRGPLRRDVAAAVASNALTSSVVPSLPGPITVMQMGSSEQLFDVSIEHVTSGGFAFLRTPFVLTADVRGPPGRTVPVTLSRDGQSVDDSVVTLDASGRGEAEFSVVKVAEI